MHEYRHVLMRMRLGESDRTISKVGLMGRRKAAELRQLADEAGWLEVARLLPEDAVLAAQLAWERTVRASSLVEPYAEEVTAWSQKGIAGTTGTAALKRKYGFEGSYSSVRRYLQQLESEHPDATVILDFEPGEAA